MNKYQLKQNRIEHRFFKCLQRCRQFLQNMKILPELTTKIQKLEGEMQSLIVITANRIPCTVNEYIYVLQDVNCRVNEYLY